MPSTLKSATEAYWGALGKLPALDAIFQACEALEERGDPINRENVKALSGVTYTNLLATGLRLYRRRVDDLGSLTHTPTSVLHVIAHAVDREFEAMQTHFEQRLSTWQQDVAILQDDLVQELEHLRARCTQQDAEIQEKNAQLEAQIEEQHSLRAELRSRDHTLRERDSQYHAALGEGEKLRQELLSEQQRQLAISRDNETRLAALKEEQHQQRQELIRQHDKETARLQAQLGNERGEWKQERTKLNDSLQSARDEIGTLTAELNQRRGESSHQQRQLKERDSQIESLQHQIQSAAGLTATIEQQSRQIEQQKAEIEGLREQNDTDANTQLKQILDSISKLQPSKGKR